MERALVELAQRGDEDAFATIMTMAGGRLMGVAFRILRDVGQAEDAVQETITTAWRSLPSLRDPDRFDGWLYRLLVHACYAEARRTRRWNANVRVITSELSERPDELLSVDDRDQLERAFRRLSPEQRAVFVLHYHLGMRHLEIARILNLPLGTVKSRLHYASTGLRAALEADGRSTALSIMERLA